MAEGINHALEADAADVSALGNATPREGERDREKHSGQTHHELRHPENDF